MVVRVTESKFELEDGRIYPHLVVLDDVSTVEEFQSIYDHWFAVFNQEFIESKVGRWLSAATHVAGVGCRL